MPISIHKVFNPAQIAWGSANTIYAIPTVAETVTAADAQIIGFSVTGGPTAGTFTLTDGAGHSLVIPVDANEPAVESNTPWGRFMAGGFSIVASVTGMNISIAWF